jgi:hypothetical protein
VCPADLSREINRQTTYKTGASQIYWCGNSCLVLTLKDKLAIVGPNDTEEIDVKTRSDGIYCITEDDGLRVTTAENTHFFEIVQDVTTSTFGLAQTGPSAKLHEAQKQMDFRNPKADEIIRELGRSLKDGIETLLEASKYEHRDIDIMKHLLTTASFAKKYSDPTQFDPNDYVTIVKH